MGKTLNNLTCPYSDFASHPPPPPPPREVSILKLDKTRMTPKCSKNKIKLQQRKTKGFAVPHVG